MSNTKIEWRNPDLGAGDLEPNATDQFPLARDVPFDLNMTTMASFDPVLARLLEAVQPVRVAEIGVFRGDFSVWLAKHVVRQDGRLDLYDVEIPPEVRERVEAVMPSNAQIGFIEGPSVDTLPDAAAYDAAFVDGDHNYETVLAELQALWSGGRPVTFLHDVGWPHARRDWAYDPSRLQEPSAYLDGRISPFSTEAVPNFGLDYPTVKMSSGGARNGTLTAVEEFMSGRSGLRFFTVPIFYGLGVLYDPDQLNAIQRETFEDVERTVAALAPILGTAELNRIMLMIRLQESGQVWRRQRDRIQALEHALAKARADGRD